MECADKGDGSATQAFRHISERLKAINVKTQEII